MVIRTQKDKKLQTLIEVCTDFASLSHTTNVHRPAEQVFALEEDDDREEEMFAVVDRQQWNTAVEGGGTTSVSGATTIGPLFMEISHLNCDLNLTFKG